MPIDDEFLRSLVDCMPDAVIVTNAESRIVFVNATCEKMFGYARAELTTEPIEILVPEHRRAAHVVARTGFARAPVARPMGRGMLLSGRRKDGTELPIDVSLGTMPTSAGVAYVAVVRDATERSRADQKLRDAESRYRQLVELAPDGIFACDAEGRYTDVNEAGCRMLGYERGELVGRSIRELVAPEELSRQAALAQRLLEGATDVSEWRLRRKDGTYVATELSSIAMPGGSLLALVRDVSERKRAEEALQRSEESLSRAQRVAHVGSFDWDLRNQTVTRSAELCALFGVSPESGTAPPRSLAAMWHPDDREEALRAVAEAEHDGRPYRLEHRIVRHDGSERIVLHQGEAVTEEGRVVRVVGTLLDITERKRIESEREQSLRQLRAVLESCPIGIALVMGPHGEDVQLNARAQALTGWPGRPEPGYEGALLQDGRPLAFDQRPSARALRGERVEGVELAVRTPSGTLTPVLASAAPILDADGAVQGAVVAVVDITVHKELERLRAEWSSIVAHDLRQPLNAIVLHAAVLRRALTRVPDDPKAKPVEVADTIARAAARMNRMIEDLLDLSRLEAHRLELQRRTTDLVSLVRTEIEPFGAALGSRLPELRVTGTIPPVNVDPDRIAQVMENLLSNAVKYGTNAEPVVVTLGATPDEITVSVSNAGPGIPPADLPRLFGRFVRVDDGKRTTKGIGLGLYITRELVNAHGGEITAESVPGGRTIFRFTIPTKAA